MRLSSSRLAQVGAQLLPGDWEVLATLERLRLATAGQLRRLHWPAESEARTARRRLAWLGEQRLVMRLERRIGGVRAGSDGFVYCLDVAGQRLLGESTARLPHQPGWVWLRHRLAVSEIFVRCQEAEAAGEFKLLEFLAEPACWRRYGAGLLKPDASLVIAKDDFEHHALIEVDCATESATTIMGKAQAYERYYLSGLEQARLGLFPKVVWVVPTARRQGQLVDVLSRRPAEWWRLHQVIRTDQVPESLTNGKE
jgi:hypothetical protein